MMNFYNRYQSIILFAVVVVVLYGAYVFFFAPSSEQAITVTTTEGGAAGPDQELIALLLELKSIHLDDALFVDPLFKSLEDFGKELVTEPVGRTNPFAPLNGVSSGGTKSTK